MSQALSSQFAPVRPNARANAPRPIPRSALAKGTITIPGTSAEGTRADPLREQVASWQFTSERENAPIAGEPSYSFRPHNVQQEPTLVKTESLHADMQTLSMSDQLVNAQTQHGLQTNDGQSNSSRQSMKAPAEQRKSNIVTSSTISAAAIASPSLKSLSTPVYTYQSNVIKNLDDPAYPDFHFKIKMLNLGDELGVVNVVSTFYAYNLPAPFQSLPGYPKPTIGDMWIHKSVAPLERKEGNDNHKQELQIWIYHEDSQAPTLGEGIWEDVGSKVLAEERIEFPRRSDKPRSKDKRFFSLTQKAELNWVQRHPYQRELPGSYVIIPYGDAKPI